MSEQNLHSNKVLRDHNLILASSSESRKRLLDRLGLPFISISPDIDESAHEGESPSVLALRLARQKAESIQGQGQYENNVIIGSDQTVACDNKLFGKPYTKENAVSQLSTFGGKVVTFNSAICIISSRGIFTENIACHVKYRKLSTVEINQYLDRDQPYFCAGSIMFERLGIAIVESASNADPTALEGFPLITLCKLLDKAGVTVF